MSNRLSDRGHNVYSYGPTPFKEPTVNPHGVTWERCDNDRNIWRREGVWVIYRDPQSIDDVHGSTKYGDKMSIHQAAYREQPASRRATPIVSGTAVTLRRAPAGRPGFRSTSSSARIDSPPIARRSGRLSAGYGVTPSER